MGFFKNIIDTAKALADLKKVDGIINSELTSIVIILKKFIDDVPNGNPFEAIAYMSHKYYGCTEEDIKNSEQYQYLIIKMISNSIINGTGLFIPNDYIEKKLLQNSMIYALRSLITLQLDKLNLSCIPQQQKQKLTSTDIADIIVAVGSGSNGMEDDYNATVSAVMSAFYNKKDHEFKNYYIIKLLHFELISVRMLVFYYTAKIIFKSLKLNTYKLDCAVIDRSNTLLDALQSQHTNNVKNLFHSRRTAYLEPFEVKDIEKLSMLAGNILHEYLANAVMKRPLNYVVASEIKVNKPQLNGITSLSDVFYATQESYTCCYAITNHMILQANRILDFDKYEICD